MALLKIGAAVATAVQKSTSAARSVAIPTLRVVGNLLHLVGLGIASDVNAVREDLLQKSRAEADIKGAEAKQRLADAIEAENRSRFSQERAQLEVQLQRAEIAKAEADARRSEAVARIADVQASTFERALEQPNQEAIEEAADRVKAASRRLNAKGGHLFVDVKELTALQKALAEPQVEPPAPVTSADTERDAPEGT
jgi:hypothetical protein